MRPKIFGDGLIKVRAEQGLADAIREIASREKTTSSEFIRRELRQVVKHHSAAATVGSTRHVGQ